MGAAWPKPGAVPPPATQQLLRHPHGPLRFSLDAHIHVYSRGCRTRRGHLGRIKPSMWSVCLDHALPLTVQCARQPRPHGRVAGCRPTHSAGQWHLTDPCTIIGHSPSACPDLPARARQAGAITSPVCSSRSVLRARRQGSTVLAHDGGLAVPSSVAPGILRRRHSGLITARAGGASGRCHRRSRVPSGRVSSVGE
jgi:hypothetical protein